MKILPKENASEMLGGESLDTFVGQLSKPFACHCSPLTPSLPQAFGPGNVQGTRSFADTAAAVAVAVRWMTLPILAHQ
jgi:hypothetical protein